MIKRLFSIFVVLSMLFNFQLSAFASEMQESNETFRINQNFNNFLLAEKLDNTVVKIFSPNEQNLDLLIGVILSVVPGFGVGHFWLGNNDDAWFFLKLDLVMLALPFAIALVSTIFSSLGLVKASTGENMAEGINVFNILGLVAWAASFGVKIWEVGSVWRFINESRTKKTSIKITPQRIEISVLNF